MSSKKTGDGVEKFYAAAQRWVNCALRSDDSLFTPDKPIWTHDLLGELRRRFLDRPDEGDANFYDKLEIQLNHSPAEVYQLMGEVLYVHFLFIPEARMKRQTKERQIYQVLDWSSSAVAIPEDLVACLTPGIAYTSAFLRLIPYQVGALIEFAEQWKEQELRQRDFLLKDPWAFKDFVMGILLRGRLFRDNQNIPPSQRNALLHRIHPGTFEGIVSDEHKRLITGAKAFTHFVTESTNDVDRKLVQIRQDLEAGLRGDFDFYDRDIRSRWDPSPADPWDKYIEIASEFLDTGRLEGSELRYKFDIGRKLAAAREAVLAGGDDWAAQVKRGFTGNLVHFTQLDNFGYRTTRPIWSGCAASATCFPDR